MPSAVAEVAFGDVVRHLRVHHVVVTAAGLVLLTVLDVVAGSVELTFPNAHVPVAYRSLILIGLACVAVGTMHGAVPELEAVATDVWWRAQGGQLAVAVGVAALLAGGVDLALTGVAAGVVTARSVLIWSALAMVSGRVAGWRLCWLAPMISILPLTYWGVDGNGVTRWWFWTDQPVGSLACWLLLAGLAVLGVGSVMATPWRRRQAARMFSVGSRR